MNNLIKFKDLIFDPSEISHIKLRSGERDKYLTSHSVYSINMVFKNGKDVNIFSDMAEGRERLKIIKQDYENCLNLLYKAIEFEEEKYD